MAASRAKKKTSRKRRPSRPSPFEELKPFADKTIINVVIETPRGKRNKLKFDDDSRCFKLGRVLPAGNAFPYDFGFIPGTRAEDGDPLDVLVLMDESTYPGCLVEARPIGIIEAEQIEDGRAVRNDRVVAVACESHDHQNLRSISDLAPELLKELEHFFKTYNEVQDKEFHLLNTRGPRRAIAAVKELRRK